MSHAWISKDSECNTVSETPKKIAIFTKNRLTDEQMGKLHELAYHFSKENGEKYEDNK